MRIDRYIGIPYQHHGRSFAGVDCYGLLILFYQRELRITLPDYDYEENWFEENPDYLMRHRDMWHEVRNPSQGDIALFSNNPGTINHAGIYVGDNKFLHCLEKTGTVSADINCKLWQKRLFGFYSYQRSTK
jgi:cell wall-associated NlpC family hydrolase